MASSSTSMCKNYSILKTPCSLPTPKIIIIILLLYNYNYNLKIKIKNLYFPSKRKFFEFFFFENNIISVVESAKVQESLNSQYPTPLLLFLWGYRELGPRGLPELLVQRSKWWHHSIAMGAFSFFNFQFCDVAKVEAIHHPQDGWRWFP